ncbi:MAG: hypothetical protein DRH24_19235 [Deltaproteobacteria bacterium]|nr:MAG: hypothetical protein DRH24_19235 [Deltaproteobacteria bacterium]
MMPRLKTVALFVVLVFVVMLRVAAAERCVQEFTFDTPDQQSVAALLSGRGEATIDRSNGNPKGCLLLRESGKFILNQGFQTKHGYTYLVTYDCKTRGVLHSAVATVMLDRRLLSGDGIEQGGDVDWARHEFVFAGNGREARLALVLREGGEAWFDNIKVREFSRYPARVMVDASNSFLLRNADDVLLWFNYPVEKIFPDDPLPDGIQHRDAIEIDAAGNEREAFQLVLKPRAKSATVTINFSDLKGRNKISRENITCNPVAYVDVPQKSIFCPFGRPGLNPDPLPWREIIEAKPDVNNPVWITVRVPKGCPSGKYAGTVRIRGDIKLDIPLELRVRNFSIPEQPTIHAEAHFRLGGRSKALDDRPAEEILEDWFRNAREHRVEDNRNWIEHLPRDWVRVSNGRLIIDFKSFDAALDVALQRGVRFFYVPNLNLRGVRSRERVSLRRWLGLQPFSPEFERLYAEYCKRIGEHLKRRKLLDRAIFYPWDEPAPHEEETYIRICKLIKSGCPEARIFVYGSRLPNPKFYGLVSGWGCNLRHPFADIFARRLTERAKLGEIIGGYGNDRYRIDYPMAYHRLWGWTLKKYGMVHMGWWAVNVWGAEPWKDGLPRRRRGISVAPGSGFFLYPPRGETRKLANSIRWEAIADGMEDYEYLTILEQMLNARKRGEGTKRVREIISRVVKGSGAYLCSSSMSRVYELRRMIADEIESLAAR